MDSDPEQYLEVNLGLVGEEDVPHEVRCVNVWPPVLRPLEQLLQALGDVHGLLALRQPDLRATGRKDVRYFK